MVTSLAVALFSGVVFFLMTRGIQRASQKIEVANQLVQNFTDRAMLYNEYLLYKKDQSYTRWSATQKQIATLLGHSEKIFHESDLYGILRKIIEDNKFTENLFLQINSFKNPTEENLGDVTNNSIKKLNDQILAKTQGLIADSSYLVEVANAESADARQASNIAVLSSSAILFVILLLSLTLIRKATGKLEEMQAKDEAMLASIGDGVIAIDTNGKIILINQAAQKMLGWQPQDLINKVVYKTIIIEDENGNVVPREKQPMYFALAGTVTTSLNYQHLRQDKTKFPVAITVTPVTINGKIIGAVEVFHDITKEKDIDKAKTEFVSLASHQLRTPLSTVSWYTEMFLDGDVGKITEKQKKYLKEIYTSNQRMVELVNALLNVSRLELGTFVVEPEPTDIIKLTESVLGEQKPQINKRKLKVSMVFDKTMPLIPADPKLLRMVVQNLLSNAVKYTPEDGKIEFSISLDKEKKNVLIKVSDTGYGIPQNQQNKIFTKLFRADNVKEKDTEGTGLGLYIVKSIIEHSGGKVWFRSEENKGTTFYITLPLTGMPKKDGTKVLT